MNGDEQASTTDPIIMSLSDRPAKHDEAVLMPAYNNFFRLIIKLGHFKELNFYFEFYYRIILEEFGKFYIQKYCNKKDLVNPPKAITIFLLLINSLSQIVQL